ncbi:unnamed protein product [Thlaspi arvense]|uniref:NADP-dependent oxidoreductase domain-containing protein n=1 Tax=Thlaspi arvense TaxID=13288 RepID=A0AAU9RJV4_THLAR|nr:unnamed protein product [Thlaspi arvense]
MHWPVRLKKGTVEFKPENIMPMDIPSTWKAMEALNPLVRIFAVGFSRDNVGKGRCSKEPSSAQTALRWGLQMGHIVLPKSTNEGRIRENFEVLGWSITEEMFGKFSEIQRSHIWCKLLIFEQLIIIFCTVQARLVQGTLFVHEKLSPYKTVCS